MVEPKCILLGVTVADGLYISAETVLKSQKDSDNLPEITDDYPFKTLNKGVVHVNTSLADGYNKLGIRCNLYTDFAYCDAPKIKTRF